MSELGEPQLPPIRRMRGWRLYAENGARYLDLRLLDSRGFLGAKGRFAGTRAKNGVDLGLLKEAPSRHEERLRKALREAYPEFPVFRFFRDEGRALAALGKVLSSTASDARGMDRADLFDPLRRETAETESGNVNGPASAAVERFFLDEATRTRLAAFPIRLLPLPCPLPFGPAVLAFSDETLAEIVPEDELPPIQPFAALRAWADFRGLFTPLTTGRRARSGEGAPRYTEALWAKTDKRLAPWFERRGPYLYARCAESAWPAFRARALAGGCVLSPEWELPSIVPAEFDDGELKKLADSLKNL